jgi:reactive intermediate/imine deaminase
MGAAVAVGGAVATRAEAGIPTPLTKEVVPGSPYPTFSRAVKCGQMVYVSGVLGQIPGSRELASADFAGQCKQAMENLKASVEAAGSSMDKVLKCGAFLLEQSDFGTFNDIYVTYFPSDPPARSTVIVKALVAPGAKIEIDCVAYV